MAVTRSQQAAAFRILNLFQQARLRPAIYFGSPRPENALHWTIGVAYAFFTLEGVWPGHYSLRVIRKHRLQTGATGPSGFIEQLRARNMADEDIVDVLLAIQIETWQEWIEAETPPRKQSR